MPDLCRRPRNGAAFVVRSTLCALVGTLALLATGCGNSSVNNGTPVFTVSATNAHFTSFIVTISGFSMTRDDGTVFTPLAIAEQADLTSADALSELLNSPAIAEGTYRTISLSLDYTTAQITVDVNGQAVAVSPLANDGTALSGATLSLTFDKSKPLVISKQQSQRFELHFDLAAATSGLNLSVSPATAFLYPFVTASLVPANSNPIHAKGAFLTADVKGGNFIMNGHPFFDEVNSLGANKVVTTTSTTFDINGTTYSGTAGLDALSKQPLNVAVSVVGAFTDMSKVTPELTATYVVAGNSVEGATVDHISGDVAARSGDSITLRGATVASHLGTVTFVNSATVTVTDSTFITADGHAGTALTKAAISVGEHVDAAGAATADSTGLIITLDASNGEVRLQSSRLWGQLNSATPGSVALNLLSLNGFGVAGFNFAGTGTATANDAAPTNYFVNSGTSDLSATAPGTLLRVDGDANAFGAIASPTSPAFTATAVTSASSTDAILEVEWTGTGTTAPFVSSSTAGMVVNLANTALGAVHHVSTGPVSLDLTNLIPAPSAANTTIVAGAATTNFALGGGSTTATASFTSFADFITAVGADLNGTNAVRKLVAVGRFDATSNTFTASSIDLVAY